MFFRQPVTYGYLNILVYLDSYIWKQTFIDARQLSEQIEINRYQGKRG